VDNDPGKLEGVSFAAGDGNPGWLRPSLMISPGLVTYVGTEVGAFDYFLSVRPDLGLPLWPGGSLSARWDLPVDWSENFDHGKPFAPSRTNARMDRLMLFQGVRLLPGLLANLGGGMVQHDTYGTVNELNWSPGSGRHSFKLVQGWANDNDTSQNLNLLLASYRLFIAPLDLSIEGTVGRFWGQDTGGMVELKRFFGDTSVALYYKDTETYRDNNRWQIAGIQFSFPLTFRRDMKAAPLQVRGTDQWSYLQETVVTGDGQQSNNAVTSGLGVTPAFSGSINRSYLNRDRLNAAYIQEHLGRLKEAWLAWRGDLQ
jgi:hypothetical protein